MADHTITDARAVLSKLLADLDQELTKYPSDGGWPILLDTARQLVDSRARLDPAPHGGGCNVVAGMELGKPCACGHLVGIHRKEPDGVTCPMCALPEPAEDPARVAVFLAEQIGRRFDQLEAAFADLKGERLEPVMTEFVDDRPATDLRVDAAHARGFDAGLRGAGEIARVFADQSRRRRGKSR